MVFDCIVNLKSTAKGIRHLKEKDIGKVVRMLPDKCLSIGIATTDSKNVYFAFDAKSLKSANKKLNKLKLHRYIVEPTRPQMGAMNPDTEEILYKLLGHKDDRVKDAALSLLIALSPAVAPLEKTISRPNKLPSSGDVYKILMERSKQIKEGRS